MMFGTANLRISLFIDKNQINITASHPAGGYILKVQITCFLEKKENLYK
jgi:hypothetical protein